jgi:Do/DeqQ family serine protease
MSRPVLALCFSSVAVVGALVGAMLAGPLHPRSAASATSGDAFASIVERVNAGVVHISVVEEQRPVGFTRSPEPGPRRGEGTGFVVDPAGYILTNQHVVGGAKRIRVRLSDRRELLATLLGADERTDLALLKVDAPGLVAVPLGDSDRLRVGEWVCAIGNPYHFDHTVTVGVVSSLGRKIYDASFDAYIQTDAAINPGNSGGPLINAAGEAIGINAAMSVHGQGIGFAVPANVAKDVITQLREHGRVVRGYLGIQLEELDPDLQRLVGLPEGSGAVVVDVVRGGAADKAGLRRYDVITAVGGRRIKDGDHLVRTIAASAPGTRVPLTVYRDGRQVIVETGLDERVDEAPTDEEPPAAQDTRPAGGGDALGLVVEPLTDELVATLEVPEDRRGVVVQEVTGFAPGLEALDRGDVIVEVNRLPTPDVAAWSRTVSALRPGESAWLYVYRPLPEPASSFLAKVTVEAP